MMALDAHGTQKMLIDNDHWADSDSDLDEYYEIAAMTVEKKTAEILIDSGSEVTVCPKTFADELGTSQSASTLRLRWQHPAPWAATSPAGAGDVGGQAERKHDVPGGRRGETSCFLGRVGRQWV